MHPKGTTFKVVHSVTMVYKTLSYRFRSELISWHTLPYLRPISVYIFMQFLFKGNLRQTKFALQDIIVLVFLQLTIVAFSLPLCKVINRPPLAVASLLSFAICKIAVLT